MTTRERIRCLFPTCQKKNKISEKKSLIDNMDLELGLSSLLDYHFSFKKKNAALDWAQFKPQNDAK